MYTRQLHQPGKRRKCSEPQTTEFKKFAEKENNVTFGDQYHFIYSEEQVTLKGSMDTGQYHVGIAITGLYCNKNMVKAVKGPNSLFCFSLCIKLSDKIQLQYRIQKRKIHRL